MTTHATGRGDHFDHLVGAGEPLRRHDEGEHMPRLRPQHMRRHDPLGFRDAPGAR